MKRFSVAIMACILAGSFVAAFGCQDPFNSTLCVYPIPEADDQFAMDGAVSAFWDDWGSNDYIEMLPPGDCYPDRCGFTDASDATLTIKAAGTSKGLYVLSIVTDNTWVDRADAEDWGADAIDFYFDKMSADEIWTCTDCLIGLYESTLTYTTQQFQAWMGATGVPDGCRYAYYDDNLWSWQTVGVTWDAAKTLYGFEVDVIELSATEKAQEWFFPWQSYGKGIEVGTLLDGMKLGFSGGYNDKDGDNPDPDCLRWLGKDPWAGDDNYWGDFHLQAGMGEVEQAMSVDDRAGAASVHAKPTAKVMSTEFFNLQGQKIATEAVRALPTGSMIMKRHTLADGSKVSEMHRIVR